MILVVDDELGVRRACTRVLRSDGFEVVVAESGREALALAEARDGEIHLALVDVVMPEMTGPELARQLRTRWRNIKILFMSGYASEHAGEVGAMEPAEHFLGKPFSAEVLTRKVREVLGGGSASSD
ncbi:MAG TPA: response regulator [Longimicrobiales bacterium]|nr:response regulator [Longimicrobiales bacterium]